MPMASNGKHQNVHDTKTRMKTRMQRRSRFQSASRSLLAAMTLLAVTACDDSWRAINDDSIPSELLRQFGWLGSAKFPDATVRVTPDGELEWVGGTWNDGVWPKGLWSTGIWQNGVWNTGTWNDGTWNNGTWRNGTWNNGTWRNGSWLSGVWHDGNWRKGEWRDGVWRGGVWYNGTWEDGIWEDGVWVDGIWIDGVWRGGRCEAIPVSRCPEFIMERRSAEQKVLQARSIERAQRHEEILARIKEAQDSGIIPPGTPLTPQN